MTKTARIIFFSLFMIFSASGLKAYDTQGYVIKDNGNNLTFENHAIEDNFTIKHKQNNEWVRTQIDPSKINRIVFREDYHHKHGAGQKKFILFYDDEKHETKIHIHDFTVHNGKELGVICKYYNKFNKEYAETFVPWWDIKSISFESIGKIKECPKCNKTFNSNYIFCPYDKTKLRFIDIKN